MYKIKMIYLFAGVLLTAAAACATLAQSAESTTTPSGGDAPIALCAGAKTAIEVRISPKGLIKSPGGERLDLLATLSHELSSQASMGYIIDVLDPHGRPIIPSQHGPIASIARATAVTFTYTTPNDLPSGAYEIRVTAAAATADGQSERSSARFFFQTDGRQMTLLDAEKFYQTSGANNSL